MPSTPSNEEIRKLIEQIFDINNQIRTVERLEEARRLDNQRRAKAKELESLKWENLPVGDELKKLAMECLDEMKREEL